MGNLNQFSTWDAYDPRQPVMPRLGALSSVQLRNCSVLAITDEDTKGGAFPWDLCPHRDFRRIGLVGFRSKG